MSSDLDDRFARPWADAQAVANDVVLPTIELRHSSFSEPVRLVADYGTVLETSPDVIRGHRCKLEASAPANAGETVIFVACMFEVVLPSQEENTQAVVQVSIDNVFPGIEDALDGAVESGEAIEVTYREYLASDLETPNNILTGMRFQKVEADTLKVTGAATFLDITNASFPNETYQPDDWPSLAP